MTRRRCTMAAMLSLLLSACSAQAMLNALVPSNGYRVTRDVAYGSLPRQRLDVYTPKTADGSAPVVVFFYGGGWRDGDKAGYKFVAQALTSRGFIAVVPNYRLYPEVRYPAFMKDAAKAVRWTIDHIGAYGGDPDNLFLMGHSAGAHIAAMLGLNERFLSAVNVPQERIRGVIGLAGPYDFLPLRQDYLKVIFGPPDQYANSQPINYVDRDEPPFLLMAGKDDHTVDPKNSTRLGARLQAVGNHAEVILYPDRGHIGIIAAVAAPLRFLGSELEAIATFVKTWQRSDGGTRTTSDNAS